MDSFILMLFFLLVIFSIGMWFFRLQGNERKIHDYIGSLGGSVISYERRGFFSGIGPFFVVGKGRTIYRIEYTLNGQFKEGWVRFGSLFGPDWRL